MTTGKTIALTKWTFVGKVMSSLLNMLFRLVIAFLPKSKRLLILWLQLPSAVILEPKFVRMAAIQKSTNNKCWRGCGEKGILLHYWWESKLVQPLWRTAWKFLKKLKRELPYDPAIPLLGIHTEETIMERDTCTPVFIPALFTIARGFLCNSFGLPYGTAILRWSGF